MRAVDLVNRNVIVTRSCNAASDSLAVAADKLFPRICPAIARIDMAALFINEEEPKMPVSVFTGCCEDGVVFGELNNMIQLKNRVINFDHDTPPLDVVSGELLGVRSPEVGAKSLLITTIAANILPATEGIVCSWVKFLIVLIIF